MGKTYRKLDKHKRKRLKQKRVDRQSRRSVNIDLNNSDNESRSNRQTREG